MLEQSSRRLFTEVDKALGDPALPRNALLCKAALPYVFPSNVRLPKLRCAILRAKGFNTVEADFIRWSLEGGEACSFDRIIMNPPFSEGRAQQHLVAARVLAAPGGRVVAVLPASHRGGAAPNGWSYEWSAPIANEFEGTSVSVVILTAVSGGVAA